MFVLNAIGIKSDIEACFHALDLLDFGPASALDMYEESRNIWRFSAYADTQENAHGCAGICQLVRPDLNITLATLPDMDWVAKSLEGLPPVHAGKFIVAGAHILSEKPASKIGIWIEAGPAFGTGHHGTTLGCLRAINYLNQKHKFKNALDIGTGSGVLAIALAKLKIPHILASDIDAKAVDITKVNIANNKVKSQIQAVLAKGTQSVQIHKCAPYDIICANILAKPLIGLAPDITRLLSPDGFCILSGLLNHQAPLVINAYRGFGLKLIKRYRINGWTSLIFQL